VDEDPSRKKEKQKEAELSLLQWIPWTPANLSSYRGSISGASNEDRYWVTNTECSSFKMCLLLFGPLGEGLHCRAVNGFSGEECDRVESHLAGMSDSSASATLLHYHPTKLGQVGPWPADLSLLGQPLTSGWRSHWSQNPVSGPEQGPMKEGQTGGSQARSRPRPYCASDEVFD
jgi:hypothetical protein